MSQVSEQYLGLPLDEGAAFFVKESAQSESGVASISNVMLETFKFVGSKVRQEYLMPQMTNLQFGMQAFENRVPDFRLLWSQFLESPNPVDALGKLDEMLAAAGGTVSAPTMRVIPGQSIMVNAYRSAESMVSSELGQFKYVGYYMSEGRDVPALPAPVNPQDFAAITGTIFEQMPQIYTVEDLAAISRLETLYEYWTATRLGDAQPSRLSPQALSSVLSHLSILAEMPEWYTYQLGVDNLGRIRPIDQLTQLEDLRPANPALAAFFPSGEDGEMPYNGATRQILEWATSHNLAMNELPVEGDVEVVAQLPQNVEVWEFDLEEGQYDPNAIINDWAHIAIDDDAGRHLMRVTDVNTIDHQVFSLEYNRVREYISVPVEDWQTVDDRRRIAYQLFLHSHRGLKNRLISGPEVAKRILKARDDLYVRASLRPGLIASLRSILDELAACPDDDVATIYDLGLLLNAASTWDQIAEFFNDIRIPLGRIKPKLPKLTDMRNESIAQSAAKSGYTVIAAGRYAPTEDNRCVIMLPIKGQGVAPVRVRQEGQTIQLDAEAPALGVAVVLEEPPSTVCSPIRAMIMTAALNHLLSYMDGRETPAGYNFDLYSPNDPFGVGQRRPCPHALLNRQMDRLEQALVHEIENATVDKMPDILRVIQQLVDAKLFLDHVGTIIDSIINRKDWIYMLQAMIVSLLIHDGATVTDSDGGNVVSLDAGIVPREAATFIVGEVLDSIRRRMSFGAVIEKARNHGIRLPPTIQESLDVQDAMRAEVLLARARNGLGLLVSLLDGSNPLVTNIHAGNLQHLIDADLALELMQAIRMAFDRDYLGLVDSAEFEAPWECVEWATQFGAFAFTTTSLSIIYEAVDVAREAALDSGMPSLASALQRVGFSWTEIAPRALRVRNSFESAVPLVAGARMAGMGADHMWFYNDAPIAHQTLKITTLVPSYDIEAYNLLKAYLTMNTSRTYFPQPVQRDVSDQYRIVLPANVQDPLLDELLTSGYQSLAPSRAAVRNALSNIDDGLVIEKCPALTNIAVIMPYVSAYLTKPALTRDIAVPQILEIDQAKSLAQTSGVTIMPSEPVTGLLSETDGLAVVVKNARSVSTALPWVGS